MKHKLLKNGTLHVYAKEDNEELYIAKIQASSQRSPNDFG